MLGLGIDGRVIRLLACKIVHEICVTGSIYESTWIEARKRVVMFKLDDRDVFSVVGAVLN